MPPVALKIILAGEGGVGKTTLLRRYVEGTYESTLLTVGADFACKDFQYHEIDYHVLFWDFAGEPRFRILLPGFCKGAHGVILVYDLSRFGTFLALDEWFNLIKKETDQIPMILVGAKSDLNRRVEEILAHNYVESNGMESYFEVSAKDNLGVCEAFEFILKKAVARSYDELKAKMQAKPMPTTHITSLDQDPVPHRFQSDDDASANY